MRRLLTPLLLAATLGLAAAPANAVFPEPIPPNELSRIRDQIEAGKAQTALDALRPLIESETYEADVLNLMGYAYRKMGQYAESRLHYTRALRLDPRHRGALEYMGELELETGDPEAARALLHRLEAACPTGCEELDDLHEAFEAHGIARD
ncbi:MAG: tetratricopeptide repeat protein [Pseudomonadota bacterium]